MLKLRDVYAFMNALMLAGLKPFGFDEDFKKAMAQDMLRQFSYATPQEMRLVGERFKGGTHWPTYKEIDEELNAVRQELAPKEERLEADAFSEGEAWLELTKSYVEQHFPEAAPELSTAALLSAHCYLNLHRECKHCPGKGCSLSGHRPKLRFSDNGQEAYLCVEGAICPCYAGGLEQGAFS